MLISGTLVHNISQESFEVLPIDSDDDHFEGKVLKVISLSINYVLSVQPFVLHGVFQVLSVSLERDS